MRRRIFCHKGWSSVCPIYYMTAPGKTQVENRLRKFFNFQDQTTYISDQAVFTLKDSGLYDEEGDKVNTSDPITESQRRSGHFLYFIITVDPDQADPNCKHSRMNCRACVQLPLGLYGINSIINTQIMKTSHDLLSHLADLEDRINPDIVTLKKKKGDTLS